MRRNVINPLLSLITLLLIGSMNVVAQNAVITGKITGSDGKDGLAGATVTSGTTYGAASDASGNYRIELPAGEHTLVYRLISYKSISKTITVSNGERLKLDISLQDDSKELGTVVVSASKFEQRIEEVTVSMEVLKPYLMENTVTTSADQALDQVPGVSMIDGQANIRGGSGWSYGAGSRVMVMVDDLPIIAADAGDAKWSFVPTENIEQAEIVKGASSVLFGSSALNGTINFRTGYPRDTPTTKVSLFQGVYDNASQTLNDTTYDLNGWQKPLQGYRGMNLMHSQKFGKLDFVAGANYFKDEGYRIEDNEERWRLNTNLRYRIPSVEGLSVGTNVNYMYSQGTTYFLWKNCTDSAYYPADSTASDYKTLRATIDPYVTYVTHNGNSHKLRTRYFLTDNRNNTDQGSKAALTYVEYQYQHNFGEYVTTTAGIMMVSNTVKSELYGDHDGLQAGAYAQADLNYGKWNVSAGARAEKYSVDNRTEQWAPVVRTGVNYQVAQGTFLRGSFGQGYRFPTIAELFVKTNLGSLSVFPDSLLKPERGWSAELGVKQGFKIREWKGFLDLAFFQNQYHDMMEFTFAQWGSPVPPSFGVGFSSINIGNTRIKGFEVSLAGEGSLSEKTTIRLLGGYNYLDPRLVSFDKTWASKIDTAALYGSDNTTFLKYRYRHTAKLDIEVNRPKWMLGTSIRYNSFMENVDNIFVSSAIDYFFPGFGVGYYRDHHRRGDAVIDFRSAWKFNKHLELSFVVKNVMNYIYMQRPADMQPPRQFVLQVKATF